ncbi:MAG: hypothetical protein R2827_11380 [Bdellovibrionales bacterium]
MLAALESLFEVLQKVSIKKPFFRKIEDQKRFKTNLQPDQLMHHKDFTLAGAVSEKN